MHPSGSDNLTPIHGKILDPLSNELWILPEQGTSSIHFWRPILPTNLLSLEP